MDDEIDSYELYAEDTFSTFNNMVSALSSSNSTKEFRVKVIELNDLIILF